MQEKFGAGQLEAPVVAGPFFILWPELSITVGVCQVMEPSRKQTNTDMYSEKIFEGHHTPLLGQYPSAPRLSCRENDTDVNFFKNQEINYLKMNLVCFH